MLNIRVGGCRQVIVIASHRPDDYTWRIKRPADTAKKYRTCVHEICEKANIAELFILLPFRTDNKKAGPCRYVCADVPLARSRNMYSIHRGHPFAGVWQECDNRHRR